MGMTNSLLRRMLLTSSALAAMASCHRDGKVGPPDGSTDLQSSSLDYGLDAAIPLDAAPVGMDGRMMPDCADGAVYSCFERGPCCCPGKCILDDCCDLRCTIGGGV